MHRERYATAMATYEPISMSEAAKLPVTYLQAAHAFLYAKQDGKFLGKYDKKYAVMVKWAEGHVRTAMETRFLGTYCDVRTLFGRNRNSPILNSYYTRFFVTLI